MEILLVGIEDDSTRQIMEQVIVQRGYQATWLSCPAAMLARLEQRPCSLIFWDLEGDTEPGRTGILSSCVKDIRTLRELPGRADAFLLVMVGAHQVEDFPTILTVGVDDFLVKPLTRTIVEARCQIAERRLDLEAKRCQAMMRSGPTQHEYMAIVERSEDGVAIVRRGKTLYRNPFWVKLLGYNLEETRDKSYFEVIVPEDRARARAYYEKRVKIYNNSNLHMDWLETLELHMMTRDGRIIPVEMKAHNIQYQGELATLILLRDISESKRFADTLEKHNAELTEANRKLEHLHRVKDELMATVSHELRTPLVTGLGYVELLLSGGFGPISEKIESRMKVALKNLRRLALLIDGMLVYRSFIDQDFINTPHVTTFNISTLCQEAISQFVTQSGSDPARARVEVPDQPIIVMADADLIRLVLANLLNNAGSHAGASAIIQLVVHPTSDGKTLIAISDNGVGMPVELRKRAFEPFIKSSENKEGYGLGLAIVHAILRAHQVEVSLESVEGQGTTVSFSLPVVSQAA